MDNICSLSHIHECMTKWFCSEVCCVRIRTHKSDRSSERKRKLNNYFFLSSSSPTLSPPTPPPLPFASFQMTRWMLLPLLLLSHYSTYTTPTKNFFGWMVQCFIISELIQAVKVGSIERHTAPPHTPSRHLLLLRSHLCWFG